MPINWQDGAAGGTPLSAANLNRLAVIADIGTAGTPTGDAVKNASKPASTITGLAAVAMSGAFADLAGKPTIPAAVVDNGDGTATA